MVGEPDELERLWTPHRMAYISGDTRPSSGYDTPEGCPFCRAPGLPVDEGLVVARGEHVYAVLNRFPYNPGHLLICPYRHVADYTDLDDAETVELGRFTQTAMSVVRYVSSPAGFNLGMNQGAVAGAGIAAHLHQHLVPRWSGDTNFMPVIGRTKTLPQLLADTRALLAAAWPETKPARARRLRAVPSVKAEPAGAKPAPGARRAAKAEPAKAASVKRPGRAATASSTVEPDATRTRNRRRTG